MNQSKHPLRSLAISAFSMLVLIAPASATWSILAVDRSTGEIGIAGASCTFDVSGRV